MAFGYAYPAYECYKTVELNKPEIEHLIFWILVSLLTVLEGFGDFTISWLPLYSEAKLIFFIYLWCPKTKGRTYVYETFFRPYISQHENDIDRNILEFRPRASDMLIIYWQKSATLGQNTLFSILKYIAALLSPSQLSRPHSSQQPQSQKQHKSQPQQQQQAPPKQPITLQRAASAAARQLGVTSQSQGIQAAPATTKVRRLTTSKSAPVAFTKPLPPNAANLAEETKTSTANLVAEEAPAPANNANAPIHEADASLLPETETHMVIDGADAATEDMAEHDSTPEKTPMEAAIRVTRARLRRRVGTGAAACPAVN
ncbi:unnamed protein product [Miscanthus lutarioriparius]|uniref:HVA22-like protein n=1 Tax=Miscanthus lutarioriparius TaxID=422564 RepID=A0A811MDF5_9POAL|nr:unnamed protein product [Miscanthus lutarioriparius]